MSFQIHIPEHEQAYLDGLALSPEAKERINRFIDFIADVPDAYRFDPQNRLKPGAPYFLIQNMVWDRWGDGHLYLFDFHVRDDKAPFGVLLIVFIDHTRSPSPYNRP